MTFPPSLPRAKTAGKGRSNMMLRVANMPFQDACTDLCNRLLSHSDSTSNTTNTTNTRTSEESGDIFDEVGFWFFVGLGLILILLLLFFIRSVLASCSGVNVVATAVLPESWPQDARAADAMQWSSTLAHRKHATLEIFRTSQVTMKIMHDDIHEATAEEQCSGEDLESGVEGGTLILSRMVATNNDSASIASFYAPPETAPNCCAICLESYQPGEVVAWSCTCKHVFHQDCIAHYLSKKMIGGETPCPCCRQQFLKWPDDDEPLEPKT